MSSNFISNNIQICSLILIGVLLFQMISTVSGISSDAIRAALPQIGDVTSGLIPEHKYEIEDSSSGPANRFLTARWAGYVPMSCPQNDYRVADEKGDWFKVDISVISHDAIYPVSGTPETYRNSALNLSGESPYEPYDALPGGVISEGSADQENGGKNYWCSIYAWFDAQTEIRLDIDGSADKYILDEAGCSPSFAERQPRMDALVKSEATRLINLVYDRLPGGESSTSGSEYDELRNVLAGYGREPGLWGDKKNATKALDLNRGPEDARIGVPTNKLLYYMLPEIIAVKKMADQLDLECNQPLYESQKGILDLVRPLLPSFEDLLKLPFGNLKKLCDIVKETSSYEFENYVVPKELEDVYKNYKEMGGGDTEEVKNAFGSVGGYYTAKEALGFKDKSDEEFYKICEFWFKLRYECEKSQSEIQYFRDHKKEIVGKIIVEYNPTLTKIEDNIRDLQSKSSQD